MATPSPCCAAPRNVAQFYVFPSVLCIPSSVILQSSGIFVLPPPTHYVWYRSDDDDGRRLILSLYIQPGAKRTEAVGLHGDALKIKLAAPPVEGAANDTL